MLSEGKDLDFVRHASAELAISFTDPRDHNLHAALNGLIAAIEADRTRLKQLEAEIKALQPARASEDSALADGARTGI